ncbi:FUSC family protein [bacterium]|nr:FUSC family protein [bacterium]
MIRSLGSKLGLDAAAVQGGLRLAFAAWLAFSIAALLHVQNAYWAAMPIWVVAQSSRGLLLERGLFRLVGTLIGAGVGLGILHVPAAPWLQLALLGIWVGVCGALTHLLQGVRSYGALLGGMTAAIVVLPTVLAPDQSLELALSRIACTLIGVLVVTLVTGLFTPKARRQAFYQRARQLAGDAVAFAADAIGGSQQDELERRILSEMSEIDAAAHMVSAGSLEGSRRLKHVHALVASSLAVMAAGAAIRARCRRGGTVPETLPVQLNALADQLRSQALSAAPALEMAALRAADPLFERLASALDSLVNAEAALFADPGETNARSFGKETAYLAPHRDWMLARSTGLVCGAGTFLAAFLGLASGSHVAELAALGVCIFSMVLGAMSTPQAIAPKLFTGIVVGALVATFYRFALQPHIETTAGLILSVAPFLLVGGLARASRRTAIPALDANMCFLLASRAGMPAASAGEILSGALALVLGAGVVSAWFMILPRRASKQAEEAARLIRQDLGRMMTRKASLSSEAWHPRTARQILRLQLHLSRASELGESAPRGLLAALNLGQAIASLQEAARSQDLPPSARSAAEKALNILSLFANDPWGTSDRLLHRAAALGDSVVSQAMRDAADALLEGAELYAYGAITSPRSTRQG